MLVKAAARAGNVKAAQLARGQRQVWSELSRLKPDEQRIWVHCASVGEFEQGRPLLEALRKDYPQYKLLVSFFSPSGYELRKTYEGADYVFYLPYDTRRNARRFVAQVAPVKAYFIKYEFWRNYLRELYHHGTPLYLVSANFRASQVFFRSWGGWYRRLLKSFSWFFVQNETSRKLLADIGFHNVTVTGDTRFDRVCRIVEQARRIEEVERFVDGRPCFVAGSVWPPDTDILQRYILQGKHNFKWIIAPHELHDEAIDRLIAAVAAKRRAIRYSQLAKQNPSDYDVLVIDNIGMLASLYRYGVAAYIGGGFGKGIHNTLEAAVNGIPVFFGPAYHKFQEAIDLVALQGAFSVSSYDEFAAQLDNLMAHPDAMAQAGKAAGDFVASGRGATAKIISQSMS